MEFESINEASRALGVNRRHVQDVLKSTKKKAGGYMFVFIKVGDEHVGRT